MSERARDARACPACGALNSPDFARCIRCNTAMSPLAGVGDALGERVGGVSFPATKAIVALTLFVFALQIMAAAKLGGPPWAAIMNGGPPIVTRGAGALVAGEPLTGIAALHLVSAVFVHYGVIHLGMNLLGLTNFARIAETVIGPARFFLGYVVTGVLGFVLSTVWGAVSDQSFDTAGASGAVFGVVGLVLGVLIRRRDPRWKQFAVQALFFLVLSSALGRVNNAAHLGGLLAGVALGFVFREHDPRPREKRSDVLVNLLAALAALACVVSIAAAQLARPHRSGLSAPAPMDPDVVAPPRQPRNR